MRKLALVAFGVALTQFATDAKAQIILARPGGNRAGIIAPFGGNPQFGYGPFGGPFGGGLFGGGGGTYAPPVAPAPNAPGQTITQGYTGRTTATQPGAEGESITGHPTRFMSYGHYFMNQGGGGAVANAQGQGQTNFRQQQAGFLGAGGDYARAPAGLTPQRPARAPSGGSGGGGRR